jgi:predicted nucleic-acid-binding Zn-ribbon protein
MKYEDSHHVRQAIGCVRCSSKNLGKFSAEMNIHFPGYEGLAEPSVWVFPQLTVCLNCGYTEFSIPAPELQTLVEGCGRIGEKAA